MLVASASSPGPAISFLHLGSWGEVNINGLVNENESFEVQMVDGPRSSPGQEVAAHGHWTALVEIFIHPCEFLNIYYQELLVNNIACAHTYCILWRFTFVSEI